jgi:hypothetical protein
MKDFQTFLGKIYPILEYPTEVVEKHSSLLNKLYYYRLKDIFDFTPWTWKQIKIPLILKDILLLLVSNEVAVMPENWQTVDITTTVNGLLSSYPQAFRVNWIKKLNDQGIFKSTHLLILSKKSWKALGEEEMFLRDKLFNCKT